MDIDKLIDHNLSLVFYTETKRIPTTYLENPIGKKISLRFRAEEFAKYLSNEDLIVIDGANCLITRKGIKVCENGGWLKYLQAEDEKQNLETNKSSLEYENLELQKEVSTLTVENLKLQNKQLKRFITYSIISFVLGAVITNVKEIIELISVYFGSK